MMEGKTIASHKITVDKTAHYFTSGKLTAGTKFIWLACHGYGQTADRFIKKFANLPEDHFIVAPEALNTFYWHSPGREPVASWMTRRHRADEIEDYLNYLEKIINLFDDSKSLNCQWIFFGFSQGCATISRLAFMGEKSVGHLVLWAGDFPRDINYGNSSNYSVPITHVLGDADQFLNPDRYTEEKRFVEDTGLQVDWVEFAGDHRIEEEIFKKVVEKVVRSL